MSVRRFEKKCTEGTQHQENQRKRKILEMEIMETSGHKITLTHDTLDEKQNRQMVFVSVILIKAEVVGMKK